MVTVLSETMQEFQGKRYYLCGNYFQRKGARLHRMVWESIHGPVPDGYHVHHKDGNRANNQPDNLELLEGSEHLSLHMQEESRRENGRRAIRIAIEAAKEWHHSEAGHEWHVQHGKDVFVDRPYKTYVCPICGKEFQSRAAQGAIYCHANCRAKAVRRRQREKQLANRRNQAVAA